MRIDLTQISAGAGGLLLGNPGNFRITQLNPIGDIDGDGRDDFSVTSYNFSSGRDQVTGYVFKSATATWTEIRPDWYIFGGSMQFSGINLNYAPIVGVGDIDGDGRADFATGQSGASGYYWGSFGTFIPGTNSGGFSAADAYSPGVAFVVSGQDSLPSVLGLTAIITGEDSYAINGRSNKGGVVGGFTIGRSGEGDFNGDGLNDLIFAAANTGDLGAGVSGSSRLGEVFVQFGRTSVTTGGKPLLAEDLAAGIGGFMVIGNDPGANPAASTANLALHDSRFSDGRPGRWPTFIGDVNGDGYSDIAITGAGRMLLLYGRPGDGMPALNAGQLAPSANIGLLEGYNIIRAAGDLNGDGYDDVVAMRDGLTGHTIFYGGTQGLSFGFTVTAPPGGISDVRPAGDVNGDGYADLIFQSPMPTTVFGVTNYIRENYVLFGGPTLATSQLDLATVTAGVGGLLIQSLWRSSLGATAVVAPGGDTNGDGFDDLLAPDILAPESQFRIVFGADFAGALTAIGTAAGGTLTGTTGADAMVGGAGQDIFLGLGGADAMRGGAGNDIFIVTDTNFRLIDGGPGTDTLRLAGQGLTLNLVPPGPRRLTEIEAVDLGGGGNTLRVSELGVLNLSGSSNTLTVTGGTGDAVQITDGGWVRGASAGGFTSFTQGQAVLRLADALAPVNAPGNARFIGTAAAESATGSAGNDTMDGGGGADNLSGGGGDDLISVAGTNFVRVDGGAGTDTLLLAGQNLRLDLTKLSTGALRGMEVVDLGAGNNTLVLTAATVLAATDGVGLLTVRGAPGDAVGFLDFGWKLSDGPAGFARYTKDGATVLVEREIAGNRAFSASVQDTLAHGGGMTFTGVAAGDRAGTSIAVGDLNGDGLADLAVGAPGADGGQGAVYVVWGRAGGFGATVNLAEVAAGLGGYVIRGGTVTAGGMTLGTAQSLGQAVTILDINKDGVADLVMGAPDYDSTGAARIAAGRFDNAGFTILASDENGPIISYWDWLFSSLGGTTLPAYGFAPQARNDAGAVFVRLGATGAAEAPASLSAIAAGQTGWMIEGRWDTARIGRDVQAMGDYDRDGVDDFVFSSSATTWEVNQSMDGGVLYAPLTTVEIVRGSTTPPLAVRDHAALLTDGWGYQIYESINATRRVIVTPLGDVNQDGASDVLAQTEEGANVASIFNEFALKAIGQGKLGYSQTVSFETRAAALGDVDGDGRPDVAFGLPWGSKSGTADRAGAGLVTVAFAGVSGLSSTTWSATGAYQIDGQGEYVSGGDFRTITILGETENGRAGVRLAAAGDVNGDGFADIMVGNAAGDAYIVFGRRSWPGFTVDLADVAQGQGGFVLRGALAGNVGFSSGDLNADGYADLIFTNTTANGGAGSITAFYGRDFTLQEATSVVNPFRGVDAGEKSSPALVDLDGDGDLDLVSGEFNGTLLAWRNTGTAAEPAFTALTGNANPFNGIDVGTFSAPVFTDLDGDGDRDLVVGAYDGTLRAWQNNGPAAAPVFTALTGSANPFNGFDVLFNSAPVFVDFDGDGDLDLVSGESYGKLLAWRNTGTAAVPVFTPLTGTANPFNGIDVGFYSKPAFLDMDGDGDLDLIVGESLGRLFAWRNTGSATAPVFTSLANANPFSAIDVGFFSAPVVQDMDGDGDLDLILGTNYGTLQTWRNTISVTSAATASIAENTAGTVYQATGLDTAAAKVLGWSLGGPDRALFNISSAGTVTFKVAPDFDAPADAGANNVYDITVIASDGALSSAPRAVAVAVTNVNEAPSVTSDGMASFAENGTGTVYTATGADPDAGTTLTWSLGGTDAALFNISAAGLVTFKAAPNFEAPADAGGNNVYDITVTASDGALSSAARAVAITVTDVNEAPVVTSGGAASIAENGTGLVYQAMATDQDAGTTLNWSLGGTDAALFAISSGGAVTFKVAPDFEAPADVGGNNVYDITVIASDGALSSAPRAVAITVTNVNEAPAVTSGGAVSLAENATGLVYQAMATDQDAGTSLSWSLGGADAALFAISSNGAVTFKVSPDFEAPADAGGNNVYDITVTASDGLLSSAAQPVAITVTNVNETPAVTSGGAASFVENGTGVVYQATGSALETGTTRGWSLGGTDAALFDIDNATGAVTFKVAPDFEAPADAGGNNVYDITVTATDGALSSAPRAVAITVTNVNEAPAVTSGSTASFTENGTGAAYQASGTDPDAGTTLSWSLGGTDAALFAISSSGAATFKVAPDFEAPADAGGDNVYDITVTASDGALSSAPRAVTITVTNVNEAPVVTSGGTASLAENATGLVYQAVATDQDAGTSLSWSLGGTDAALFDIDNATGAVTFKVAPDFEAPADVGGNNIYDITVTASDGVLNSAARAVTITVTNVNEAAPVITSGTTASFAENGTGIAYQAVGTDLDAGTTLAWSLSGADAARFTVDGTGAVRFRIAPDFENPADAGGNNVYDIVVGASDGTLTASRAVAITVTDVLDAVNRVGTSGNDTLIGDALNDSLVGGDGDDSLIGLAGNDTLSGGNGNDTVVGGQGNDTLIGGAGIDTLDFTRNTADQPVNVSGGVVNNDGLGGRDSFGTEFEVFWGGSGNDTISYSFRSDNSTLAGYGGDDSILGGSGADMLQGGEGNDTLNGFLGNDTVMGGGGNDFLIGGSGDDSLMGGAGDDTLQPGIGLDTLDGGEGIDTADYSNLGAVTGALNITIAGGTRGTGPGVQTGTNTFIAVENIIGSQGNDVVDFRAATFASALTGGLGNDRLLGGTGNDTIEGQDGDDSLDGGAGTDTLSYASATAGVSVSLAVTTAQVTGGAGTDTVANFENLTGGAGNDTLTGSDLANVMAGGAGQDIISGAAGNDTLLGGDGNDTLEGGSGDDSLDGGAGTDTASYASALAAVRVNLSLTTAQNTLGAGTDLLAGIEALLGSDFNDTLTGGQGADLLVGADGNDALAGNAGNDTLIGGAGNDALNGGAGADSLEGGEGTDSVSYSGSILGVVVNLATQTATGGDATGDTISGIESVTGGNGNDQLTGDALNNSLSGGAGNDTLIGGAGNDALNGGAGADSLEGGEGTDSVSYSGSILGVVVNLATQTATGGDATGDTISGIESVTGGNGNDQLTGDALNNSLSGGAGNDTLIGGAGNDALNGGAGADSLEGGEGTDSVSYSGSVLGVVVNLATQTATGGDATGDTISGIESVTGGHGNDQLTGNALNNSLSGGAGNDTLIGGAGNDALNGGAGADSLEGGDGTDTVSYSGSALGVVVNLATQTATGGDATGDTISGIESVTGGNGNDQLTGDALNNSLSGGAGNDTLIGGAGNDALNGGAGADSLEGGEGTDSVSYSGSVLGVVVNLATQTATGGDATGDTISGIESVTGGNGNDQLTGDALNNSLSGGAGNDTLIGGAGNDALNGGAGADSLEGGEGTDSVSYSGSILGVVVNLATQTATGGDATGDTISGFENVTGGNGDDSLTGDALANSLSGGAGNDTLIGGGGNDYLDGGIGTDQLEGGSGADRFYFRSAAEASGDVIIAFSAAEGDRIDLRAVDANTSLAGDQAFAWIGGASFGNLAGQLRFAAGKLEGDVDGNGVADFQIGLNGVASLSAANIWL